MKMNGGDSYDLKTRPLRGTSRQAQSLGTVQATLQGVYDSNEDNEEDPSTVGEAVSELTDGYPVRYDCIRGVNESLSQLVVEFDYEYVVSTDSVLVTPTTSDVDSMPKSLPAMEWGLLWTVAYDLGLHGCKMLSDRPESLRRLDATDDELIVSLSSRPLDTLDPTTSKLTAWCTLHTNH